MAEPGDDLNISVRKAGGPISFKMGPFPGEQLLDLSIRRGVSSQVASVLLRKIADHIDAPQGAMLLSMEYGEGWFSAAGDQAERDDLRGEKGEKRGRVD